MQEASSSSSDNGKVCIKRVLACSTPLAMAASAFIKLSSPPNRIYSLCPDPESSFTTFILHQVDLASTTSFE